MKRAAGRLAALAALAGGVAFVGGFALSPRGGTDAPNAPDTEVQETVADGGTQTHEAAQIAPEAQIPNVDVKEILAASKAVDELQSVIAERSKELAALDDLIAERQGELAGLEAMLAEKGLELRGIMDAIRTRNREMLDIIDNKIQKAMAPDAEAHLVTAAADPIAALESDKQTVVSAPEPGQNGAPDADFSIAFEADLRKIGEIVQQARLEANPDAAPTDNRLLVRIHFEIGSSDLTIGGQTQAMAAAQVLSGMPLHAVRLEAHTDTVGPADANARLAAERADAVARILSEAGIPQEAIETKAYGEDRTGLPVMTPDGTPEPLNRSVSVYPVALTN
ncbi:MAG: OmpA family protein [Pseudomonadota bacterium]